MRSDTWLPIVAELMQDIISQQTIESLIANPPKYIVADDLSWLSKHIPKSLLGDFRIEDILTFRFRERFHAIRTCHATRTNDVDEFYRRGICRLDEAVAVQKLRELLVSESRPTLDENRFQEALDDVGFDLRSGRVYFSANENMIIEYCAHYLLYGGEHAQAVSTRVWPRYAALEHLKTIGQPTLFICDVPLSLIGDGGLTPYAATALSWFLGEKLSDPIVGDYGEEALCIHADLPPDAILGHYHPKRVRDPLNGLVWVNA